MHQYRKHQQIYEENVSKLLIEVDVLRSEHPGCGVEKMYYTLRPDFIGRDNFIELLMDLGYRVIRPKNFIRTTIPAHYKYPNLIEGSVVTHINQVWQSDITYIKIGENYFYLIFIIDVYSRRILSWQASDHMRATANVKALKAAIKLRVGYCLKNLIHHSDRGSQYISHNYTRLLKSREIQISMGMQATENAYAERVNGIIKNEFLKYREMKSLRQLKIQVRKAVTYYNTQRIHNSLKNRQTPIQFEENLINLDNQKRPTVIIYTDGYEKFKEASSHFELQPETNLGVHICPIYAYYSRT